MQDGFGKQVIIGIIRYVYIGNPEETQKIIKINKDIQIKRNKVKEGCVRNKLLDMIGFRTNARR